MVQRRTNMQARIAAQKEFMRILSEVSDPPARVAALRAYLHQPGWDEGIIFALRDCGDEAGRALYLLTLDPGREPSAHEHLFHRDLIFTLNAINGGIKLDTQAEDALVRELLPALFDTAANWQKPKSKVASRIIDPLHQLADASLRARIATAFIPYTKDHDRDVRRVAAYGLGWVQAQSDAAIAALLRMLREDEDEFLRGWVAQVLYELNPSAEVIAALRERLHADSDDHVLESLASVLTQAGFVDEVISELVSRIRREGEDFAHKCVIYALHNALRASEVKKPELADLLLDLLRNHTSGGVRYAVAGTLADVGDNSDQVIDALFYNLEHDDDDVVHCATLDSLVALRPDDHAIVERLIDLLLNSEKHQDWPLTERLARMKLTDADIDRLITAIENADWSAKSNAGNALKQLATRLTSADVERLIAALEGDDWEKINAAGDLLRDLAESSDSWRTFMADKALTNRELRGWIFREFAEQMVAEPDFAQAEIATWLNQLRGNSKGNQRKAASELLKLPTLTDEIIAVMLERLAKDDDEYLRAELAKSLPKFAATHPAIVPAIIEQVGKTAPLRVRIAAAQGLGQAGSSDPAVATILYHTLKQSEEPHLQIAAAEALIGLGEHRPETERVLHQIASRQHKWSVFGSAEDEAFKLLYKLVVDEAESFAQNRL